MFNQQMKKYNLENQVVSFNDYNEKITEYKFNRVVEIAIAANNRSQYGGNNTLIDCVEYVGITRDKNINKGDKIGGYLVEYVEQDRLYSIVHMKEIDNNGRF